MRRLLGLSAQTQVVGVAAEIMQRGRGWFAQSISLDRGANAGVRPGQAIVDGEGLIGQIVRVFADASEGVLLTQAGQLTPVYVERTGQRGLTAGEGAGRLELRYIPQHADLKVGDRLLTSGLDGVFPAGLKTGTVESVAIDGSLFKRIVVRPCYDRRRLSRVAVLTRTIDAPLPGSR